MQNTPRSDSPESAIAHALVSQMEAAEASTYLKYGHRAAHPAYVGQLFIVYRANRAAKSAEPLAFYAVRELSLSLDGLCVKLENLRDGTRQHISHVPQRLGRYAIFMDVPPVSALVLELDGAANPPSATPRPRLSAAVSVKTRNAPAFHNMGNTYLLPLSKYVRQFGEPQLAALPGQQPLSLAPDELG